MQYDRQRVQDNASRAETEDLLDRVTVYRSGMEPDALYVIEEELRRRRVTAADIDEHARRRLALGLQEAGGLPAQCSFCRRPAVVLGWGWQRLDARWLPRILRGRLPIYPRRFWYCDMHRPYAQAATPPSPADPHPPA